MHVRAEVLVKATVKTIMSVVKYAGYLKCGTFMKSDKEVVVFVAVLDSRTVESQSTRSSIMVGSRVSESTKRMWVCIPLDHRYDHYLVKLSRL